MSATNSAVALISLLLLVSLLATPAKGEPLGGQDASEHLYLTYCSACHGTDGKGAGTLAKLLKIQPADLTQFSASNGGTFPFRTVLRAIDGRMTVRAHGDSSMPVWGKVFAPPADASMRDQLEAYGRMFLITFYLESIQEPAPAE